MMHRVRIACSRYLAAVFSFCVICFLPTIGDCRTPADLASLIQAFNQSTSQPEQLDLAYHGLDLYAPITDKSSVDPADRVALSKMKRVVLTDAIAAAGGNVLIAGIGSTGNWVAKRPGLIVNDYPAGDQDKIVQLKLKGSYMEGLSDLDFVVMGPGAEQYQTDIYHIFAAGRDGVHLTPEEMNELEINFITDEQIRSLASGPKGRNFWNQLMDLSNSSAHAEKYITKGGKALYGMAHLYENGAVITLDKQKPAMVFADYARRNGHKMGPFSLSHLFGGACDMDYFIAHSREKTQQERVKTVLQVIKYLKRDAWMLKRAAKNLARLPNELPKRPERAKILKDYAADLIDFTDRAIRTKVWRSAQATAEFGKEAQDLSGLVCSSAHEMLIRLGDDLLALRAVDQLTATTSAILNAIVYDLETVDKKRYRGKYPAWYAPEYSLVPDKPRDETLEFLKRYRKGHRGDEDIESLVILREEQREKDETELGPVVPPPVSSIEVTQTSISPAKPTAGAPVTITLGGTLHGLSEKLPDFTQNNYSDKEKELMKELAEWSLRASLHRMQLRYLMEQDVLSRNGTTATEKIYVSPYEIEAIAEDLEIAGDEVAYLSEQMDRGVSDENLGDYDFHVRAAPSPSAIDDYLSLLENSCNQGLAYVKAVQPYATSFYATHKEYVALIDTKENNEQFENLVKGAEDVKLMLNGSLTLVSEAIKRRKQIEGLMKKDPSTAAGLLKELEAKLENITKETTKSLVQAEKLNTDLMVVGAKTHQLLAQLDDSDKAQAARKKGEALLKKWGNQQLTVNKETLPGLQKKALWLKGGAWAAKTARLGFEAYAGYQHYKKNQAALTRTDFGGGAEDAVLALVVAGKAMEKVIDVIPIPVLNDMLKGYATILSDSAKWAIAIDSAQSKMYQDLGFDIRSTSPPAAYSAILKKHSSDARPALFFNRMRMPLAEYNGLTILASPDQDMKWLVWSKHSEDGYLLIDDEVHRKISQYSAWYRRVHGQNISGEDLFALLKKGKIDGGVFGSDITVEGLKRNAKRLLEYKALSAYLKSLTKKKSFTGGELMTYRLMLFQAARQFAKEGFLLTDVDIKKIMDEVLYDAPIEGGWGTALNVLTLTPGRADLVNQGANDWDKITGGEKERLEAVLKKLIQDKVDRRTRMREQNWKEAKQGGDDGKPIAAGLLYSQVGLVFNHALFSQEEGLYADDFIDVDGDTFTLSWETTIPDGVDLTNATYVGMAEIAGYPGSRIQIAIPMETNENKILEEMIALAEEAEELGNTAWSSCQQAVAAFSPFETKLDDIKALISELQKKSNTLKALNSKVGVIPGKLKHHLSEVKRLAVAIEKDLKKIDQLSDEICAFEEELSSSERGEQVSLMAQIHTPMAELKKKSQRLNLSYDKAQKDVADWEQFNSTLEELDTLLNNAKGWVEPLLEEFRASVGSLATAEKDKLTMARIKTKADLLLREAEKVYSKPESSESLDEIKIAHGRVLHPLNLLSGCLDLAADKKVTAAPWGNKLKERFPQAEKSLETAAKTKARLDVKEKNNIEQLSEELKALVNATNEQVLQAERTMGQAQLCFDRSAEPGQSIPVPDLRGKTLSSARKKLAVLGLKAVPSGGQPAPTRGQAFQVASQEPEPGTMVAAGQSVSIIIYSNYLGISVPDVTGLSVADAKEKLQAEELTPQLAGGDPAPQKELAYTVQSQWPEADDKVAAGTAVKLKVYGAVQYKSVPSIIGMTTAQAKSTLASAGFKASLYGGDAAPKQSLSYKIAAQSPDAGAKEVMGAVVSAHVYGKFDKEAALAQSTCKNFPGTMLRWDDAKEKAMCVCPAGQILDKNKRCIKDPKIAENNRKRREFWNAVVSTAIPIIANEITSSGGGKPSSGGSTGGSSAGGSRSSSGSSTSGGSSSSSGGTSKKGGDPDECEIKFCPSCKNAGIDLFKVATNDQCNACRKSKSNEINRCIQGEKTGQGTKLAPPDYYVVLCEWTWNETLKKNVCNRPYTHHIYHKSKHRPNSSVKVYGPDSYHNCYTRWIESARQR